MPPQTDLEHLDADEGVRAGGDGLTELPHQGDLLLVVHEDLDARRAVRPPHVLVLLYVQPQTQPPV